MILTESNYKVRVLICLLHIARHRSCDIFDAIGGCASTTQRCDNIFLRDGDGGVQLKVESATLGASSASPAKLDPTLYPSDYFAVVYGFHRYLKVSRRLPGSGNTLVHGGCILWTNSYCSGVIHTVLAL